MTESKENQSLSDYFLNNPLNSMYSEIEIEVITMNDLKVSRISLKRNVRGRNRISLKLLWIDD